MKEMNDYIERIQSALHTTIHKMQPEILESMHAQGITPTQFFVLVYLKKQGSCKVSQLAEQLDVKPSAVTFMVDRLEQNELVQREHDKKDRRVVNISLTMRGEEKLTKVIKDRKAIVERYLGYLNDEELSFMADITEKLAEAVIAMR
ncbi:MarR family transcriptional regulator [Bacillus sp. 165]|uniref:MarR family winged helix-turn-helix transcriptional regulator n=1 Tax=Bacillus sp. 165 TaxID=1529117 RepID=UPI001ADB70CE|nr:MarR family transcriptional regulator [Bacillus sp. 165]MBO9130833.1 MarR family transcriptional regulator [Bacillus sp. 165]